MSGSTKFLPGDLARIGGAHRDLPKCYPWLRPGRLMRVQSLFRRGKGRHTLYRFVGRRRHAPVILAVYDLRHPDDPFKARGAAVGSIRS